MREKTIPISNKRTVELIGEELTKMYESYGIIFYLLLETGMPLENIPTIKVKDISDRVIVFTPSHKNVVRSEYISTALHKRIKAYIADKDPEAPAFYAIKDASKPFPLRNFQKALSRVSKYLALEQPVTALSIRKTYLLNVFLREHNYQKIYALTNCRSIKSVLEYLNLDVPAPENKYLSGYTVKEALIEDKVNQRTLTHVNKVLEEIQERINSDKGLSYEYCEEVMHLNTSIEEALSRFESLSDNTPVLKDLYLKKS